MLLIVPHEMLDSSRHPFRLKPIDIRRGNPARERRIFGEGLECPSAKRGALDIDGGSEETDSVARFRLCCEESTGEIDELVVEGRTDARCIGE